MSRLPRKLKKRRKNAERDRLVKEIMSEVLMQQLDKHYQETLPEIFPILRLPPMTDEQKKAIIEYQGGKVETMTLDEITARGYLLTEEERKALFINSRRHK